MNCSKFGVRAFQSWLDDCALSQYRAAFAELVDCAGYSSTYVIVVDLPINVALAVLTLALAHAALHTFPVRQLEAVRIYTRR